MKYTTLSDTLRYDHPCWPGFYILIVPDPVERVYNFYLTHSRFGVIHFMFGSSFDNADQTPEKLAELAHWNMEEYLPDYVRACCTDEESE